MATDYGYLDEAFEEAARIYGVDPDILRGVGFAESRFRPDAVSPRGAIGMMQFMPDTAKEVGIDPKDPVQSVFGAAAYLRRNLDRFNGDYAQALAGYNWGPNREGLKRPDWHTTLPAETTKYIDEVLNYATGKHEKLDSAVIKPKLRPSEPPLLQEPPLTQEPAPTARTAQPKAEEVPERTLTGTFGDVANVLLKGAVSVPQMAVGLADLVSGGAAGKKLEELGFRPEEAKKILDEELSSEAQKAARARVQKSEGFVERAKALAKEPSVLAETVGESVFPMLAGGVLGRGVSAATGARPLIAGAAGEGLSTAGGMAATMREESENKELEAKKALAALGAGLGTTVFGVAGGKLAEKLKLADIDTLLVRGADDAANAAAVAKRGFMARVVGSGISEGAFEELPQSAQETMWENFANDRPLMQGVPESAATGLMTGTVMGGVAGGAARRVAPPEAEAAPETPTEAPPEAGAERAQRYDEQYFPIDEQGRRIVEEAPAEPAAAEPAPVEPAAAEPVKRAPRAAPEVATEDIDRTKPAGEIVLGMPDIRRLAEQNGYGTGVMKGPTGKWWETNVAGKSLAEVQALVAANPDLLKGRGSRAELLRQLAVPETAAPAPTPTPVEAPVEKPEIRAEAAVAPSGGVTERAGVGVGVEGTVQPETRVEPAAGVKPSTTGRVGGTEQLPTRVDVGAAAQPAAVTATAPTPAEPKVSRSTPPADPNAMWAPTVTLDYGKYTITNDGADVVYQFKTPETAGAATVNALRYSDDGISLFSTNKNGKSVRVLFDNGGVRLENMDTGAYTAVSYRNAGKYLDQVLGKDVVKWISKSSPDGRLNALKTALANKFDLADLERFSAEYVAMLNGEPLRTPQVEPAAPASEPDPELERLRPILPEAALDTDLRDAREDWKAGIDTRLSEAKTRWEADESLKKEDNPAYVPREWKSLPIERKYEAAKIVDWDALPDERKVEWVQAAIDRYSQPQADQFYQKRFNQISNDVMREPPKPLPPAKTREENLTYPSLAKAQEVSTQLESRIEATRQERKVLATEDEQGRTVPPADGTPEGLKYDKLTGQITELESPKPLPPVEEVFAEEIPGPKDAVTIARNNVNRAFDRGDIDAPAAGKLYSMIEAGKAKQAIAMLNRLRSIKAEPGTTGVVSDLRQRTRTGPRTIDFVRELFAEQGEGAPIPKASYDAVEAGNASEALNALAAQGSNDVVRETAARIAPLLANTRAELVEDLRTPEGRAAAGAAASDGSYIRLDRTRGMDEETLVHEGVHAAAERVIAAPEAELTEPQRSGKRELNAVWSAARADKSIPLTDAARSDVSEFASEAMSRKDVQEALRAKTAPETGSLWNRFKRAVMRMVGLHQPKNMRDATVEAMDKVFTAVPEPEAKAKTKADEKTEPEEKEARYSLSPDVKRGIETLPKPQRRPAATFVKAASDSISDLSLSEYLFGAVDKFVRTNIFDKMATLEMRIARVEGYSIRNALGEVTPLLQMRQAYDADKLSYDYFRYGGLEFDPSIRQFKVVNAETAPDDVLKAIAAWAKANNMSFQEAYGTYLPKVFEAVRLHNIEEKAKAEGKKSTVTPHLPKDFIKKAVKDYEADPELKEISRLMDEPRVRLIELGVKTGRWTREEADQLTSVVGYVPFDRLVEAGEFNAPDKRIKAGITAFGKIPELVGTTEFEVKNVFDNYFSTLSFLMSEAVRNGSAISTLRYMEKLGLAKDLGINPAAARSKATTVNARIDGVMHYFEVPSRYDAVAFKYDTVPADGVRKFLGATSKFFRASITLYPTFSAKQLVDDVQRAAITSGAKNVAAVTANALQAYTSLVKAQATGERHPLAEQFGRMGLTAEIDWERQDPASSYMKDRGFKARGLGDPFTRRFMELVHRLDGVAHASDLAVRSAVYEQIKKETGDDARAIAAARELINFRRQGASSVLTNYLIPSLPFFNAKLQGVDILYRAITGRGAASGLSRTAAVKSIATRGALAMAVGTIYALAKAGDDEYEELGLEKRDRVWVLGGGVALPVPMELGVMFKLIPERALEYFRRHGTPQEQAASEAFITWFNTAFMTYAGSPLIVPQAVKPLVENFINYSFFTNRPLVGKYLQNLDRSEQTVASTSEFAKGLAAWVRDNIPGSPQISPIHIDNFVQGYAGSMGSMFNMVIDAIANPDKLDRPLHRVVGLGPFTYDTESSSRKKDEFYKLREEAEKAHNTLALLATQGDVQKYNQYNDKLLPLLAAYDMTTLTLNQLSTIRSQITGIQSNKELIARYKELALKEVGADKAEARAKELREEDLKKLRVVEKDVTEWVRTSQAEINRERQRIKSSGINLDAKP